MYNIYYAHHQWKYNTTVEMYEVSLIRRYFPNATLFNPSIDLKTDSTDEAVIMKECLETVRNSDILVYSSLDGCVGKGVYLEVAEAKNNGKLVLYIYQDSLVTNFEITKRLDKDRSDRLYGTVNIK